jgi:hypothetical protein
MALTRHRKAWRSSRKRLSVTARAGVPDFDYIRHKVPIREIAGALGLNVSGNMVRCWRSENHQHGDRTPSVGLHQRRNTAMCFVCDSRSLSTIDLVMSVRNAGLLEAVAWITQRYDIPNRPKGKHAHSQQRWPERYRLGSGTSRLEFMVKCLVWASLTPSERSILGVLDCFSDGDTVTISYRGIMRYAGIGSQSTVANGPKRLQNLHVLKKAQNLSGDGLRSCGAYNWTLADPAFEALARQTHERQQAEIVFERAMRTEARKSLATHRKAESAAVTLESVLIQEGRDAPRPVRKLGYLGRPEKDDDAIHYR